MEASFVLLLAKDAYSHARKIQVDLSQKFLTKATLKLEPHITLKYAFPTENLDKIESYFDELIATTKSFPIEIDGFGTFDPNNVLFLNITKNANLRDLHLRILRDMQNQYGIVPAEYEGENFHFHVTMAYKDISHEIFEQIKTHVANLHPKLTFLGDQIGMYVRLKPEEDWFLYKSFPVHT